MAQVAGEQHRRLGGHEDAQQDLGGGGVARVGEGQLVEAEQGHRADDDHRGQQVDAQQQERQHLGLARPAEAEGVAEPADEQRERDRAAAGARAVVRAVAEVVDDTGARRCQPSANTSSMRRWSAWMRTSPRPSSSAVSRTRSCTSTPTVGRSRVEGEQPAARLDRYAGRGERPAHPGLRVVAEDLDQQGAGGVEEVAGLGGAQQPAAVEDHHVVADPLELAEQVGGDQHRDAEVLADPLHQAEHVVAGRRVEAVGRLVEQHQPRVVGERLRELGALLHAGGVAAHRPVALLGQADVAQHLGGPLAGGDPGQAGHHRRGAPRSRWR